MMNDELIENPEMIIIIIQLSLLQLPSYRKFIQ